MKSEPLRYQTPYRIFVLVLTVFYFLDEFRGQTFDLAHFGWQFRFLTIWGLTLSMIAAGMMLTGRYGQRDDRGAIFVSCVAVINMVVVFTYWRLFYEDPNLVLADGKQPALYREYYLHLIGPLLQWIDLLYIKRAFRFPLRTAAWLVVVVACYTIWVELLVQPMNATPAGSVTNGLPYPFLNNMTLDQRFVFYGATYLIALVFTGLFWVVQILLSRQFERLNRVA